MEIVDKPDNINSDSQSLSVVIEVDSSEQALAELRYQAMASFNDIVLTPQPSD